MDKKKKDTEIYFLSLIKIHNSQNLVVKLSSKIENKNWMQKKKKTLIKMHTWKIYS